MEWHALRRRRPAVPVDCTGCRGRAGSVSTSRFLTLGFDSRPFLERAHTLAEGKAWLGKMPRCLGEPDLRPAWSVGSLLTGSGGWNGMPFGGDVPPSPWTAQGVVDGLGASLQAGSWTLGFDSRPFLERAHT